MFNYAWDINVLDNLSLLWTSAVSPFDPANLARFDV